MTSVAVIDFPSYADSVAGVFDQARERETLSRQSHC